MLPKISIVITTKNEEKNISNCLDSIKFQTYPKNLIEIIVVDNNSSDKTKEIAKKYTKNVFDFGPERSAQRNFGMLKKATGKYVMYLDADMILSSVLIEKAVEKLSTISNTPPVALYIPEIILGNSYWSRVRRFERSFYDGTVIDCVRIIKTDIFKKTGGFDEKMTGPEDWDLDKKIRQIGKVELLGKYDFEKINKMILDIRDKILEQKELKKIINLTKDPVIFHNEADFNLRKYLSKKKYYSKSFNLYIEKWGRKDNDIKKQFGFKYRYFLIFLEKVKWKIFLKQPKYIFGVLTLRFLVGINYFFKK